MSEGELKQVVRTAKWTGRGKVRVIYGIHALEAPLAGRTVGDVRRSLAQALNISPRAVTVVDGIEVDATYILQEGEQLEFVRLAGEKGSARFYNRPIPLYYQLEQILRSKVEAGEFSPGQRLPTEQELSREFGVSRATVRQALAALVSEGLLRRKQGKGTFITEKVQQTKSVKFTGFTEDLFHQGYKLETQVLEIRPTPASDRVAAFLRLAPGSEVIRFKRLRFVEGTPLSYVINYMPPEIGIKVSEEDLRQHTMLSILEQKLQIPLGTIRHIVEAIKADIEIASLLSIGVFDPILYIETDVFSQAGNPVEIVDTYFRADRYRYTVELIRKPSLKRQADVRGS